MGRQKFLINAKKNKNDEFYTQLVDINRELVHYTNHFKDKVVLCNCDDPYESNFFQYFALNFNTLGLKKLICVGYENSPFGGSQLNFFGQSKPGHVVEINEVKDFNGDGRTDLADVEWLLQNDKNTVRELKGNGDFRSQECIELLKEADIVVTNPPFSLFREYIQQLIDYDKKFLIIGNINCLNYKEVFPLIKENKAWLGMGMGRWISGFIVPDDYPLSGTEARIDENGNRIVSTNSALWLTNLDNPKRHEDIPLFKKYNPEEYPKYDNYDAIEVGKTAEIPKDYNGIMGVPITFLGKYNPNQFKILGCTQRGCHDLVPDIKKYDDFIEMRQDGTKTGSSGSKTNENANIAMNDGKHNYFVNKDGYVVQSKYGRVFIQRK